ncbi:MAG: exo-alpha-sialidase [Chitinophagaceae bacterium]|nr:exo-alpha-sialidase [Chitinophagaceae bacterium]
MQKLLPDLWPCFLLLVLASFNCSKKTTPPPSSGQIKVSSFAPATPVLNGMATNPFLRIVVQIFSGNPEQQYRKIQCTLNTSALNEVQKVDVYLSGEAFTATNLIGTSTPSSANFDIPVTVNLQPGIHYIWLSVVLKNDAALNNKIELHATKLIDASAKELAVDQGSSVYTKLTGVAVRKAGEDNVNTYRIPGIAQTDRGTLLSVYDIRYNNSADLPGNIDVGLSRSTDSGRTWEPMKIIMDMGAPHENNGIGDPAILFDPVTKKIFVAALWSKGNRSISGSIGGMSPDSTGQFVLVSSTDDGITWSAPYTITPQVKEPAWKIFFNGPGSGIAMQDGKLVFAAQYWTSSNVPYSTIIYSDNQGAIWKGKILGPKSNTTESQVVETTSGTLMLNMRDNRGSFRSVATTSNMGTSWTEHSTSYNTLPDPVCMGSLIKAKVNVNGTLRDVLFFSNPNSSSGRVNITIKASLDLGQTWLPANQLLIDERQCYGYSSLTKIDDNTVGILYEGTKDLYFVKVAVSEIVK